MKRQAAQILRWTNETQNIIQLENNILSFQDLILPTVNLLPTKKRTANILRRLMA